MRHAMKELPFFPEDQRLVLLDLPNTAKLQILFKQPRMGDSLEMLHARKVVASFAAARQHARASQTCLVK